MKPEYEVVEYDIGKGDYRNVSNYDKKRYVGAANDYKKRVTGNAYRRLIGPLEGKKILDVGCGTGRGVADFVDTAQMTIGVDASYDMLLAAAQKVEGRPNVALVASYAQSLPFPASCFDVVTSLNFLHLFSLPTQSEMIAEMKRVAKPGGMIVLEFDNAIHGLGLGLFKRWTGREHGSLPSEIRQVIGSDCKVTAIYGAVFPVIWRLFHRWPSTFLPIEELAYRAPINWMAHRIFFQLLKPQTVPNNQAART
jgi:ubiquinone/menaquinone biosynthesis C-methylase UbiE